MASRSAAKLLQPNACRLPVGPTTGTIIRHSDVGWNLRVATKREERLIREALRVETEGWAQYDQQHRLREPTTLTPGPTE